MAQRCPGPAQRDEVCSCLFYNAEPIKLQLTEYRRFPAPGVSGQYESLHALPRLQLPRYIESGG